MDTYYKEICWIMDEKSVVEQAFQTINDMLIDRGIIKDRTSIDFEKHKDAQIFAESIKIPTATAGVEKEVHVVFYLCNKFTMNQVKSFFENSNLTPNSHMIFVYKDKMTTANETSLRKNYLKSKKASNEDMLFEKIEIFCIKNLLFNITKHKLVPKHELLKPDEATTIYDNYSIKENQRVLKLPLLMTKTDPVSKYYDFKPGSLIKITRPSSSVGEAVTYRYCV